MLLLKIPSTLFFSTFQGGWGPRNWENRDNRGERGGREGGSYRGGGGGGDRGSYRGRQAVNYAVAIRDGQNFSIAE